MSSDLTDDVDQPETDDESTDLADLDGYSLVREPAPWWAVAVGLVMSVAGLGVAIYLTVEHFSRSLTLACPDTGKVNCVKVTSSKYSEVLGVPVVIPGLVFFAVLLVLLSPWAWRSSSSLLRAARLGWTAVGLLSVFYLVWAETVQISAICLYCTSVHVLTFLTFVLVVYVDAIRPPRLVEDA